MREFVTTWTETFSGASAAKYRGTLAVRDPMEFTRLSEEYAAVVEPMLTLHAPPPTQDLLRFLAARIGTFGGGPCDVIDMHTDLVERIAASAPLSTDLLLKAQETAEQVRHLVLRYHRASEPVGRQPPLAGLSRPTRTRRRAWPPAGR